jgi:hypothetical protein
MTDITSTIAICLCSNSIIGSFKFNSLGADVLSAAGNLAAN